MTLLCKRINLPTWTAVIIPAAGGITHAKLKGSACRWQNGSATPPSPPPETDVSKSFEEIASEILIAALQAKAIARSTSGTGNLQEITAAFKDIRAAVKQAYETK
jgi:hypothetical protein